MSKQVVKTSSKGSIRGLDINLENGKLFCSCFEDGYVHFFNIAKPITAESHIEKIRSIKGFEKPRNLLWWEERQELYVGHAGGIIAVYKLDAEVPGPVCKLNLVEER